MSDVAFPSPEFLSIKHLTTECCSAYPVEKINERRMGTTIVCNGCDKPIYIKRKYREITVPEEHIHEWSFLWSGKRVTIHPAYKKKEYYYVLSLKKS